MRKFLLKPKAGTEELNYGRDILAEYVLDIASDKTHLRILDIRLGSGKDLVNIRQKWGAKTHRDGRLWLQDSRFHAGTNGIEEIANAIVSIDRDRKIISEKGKLASQRNATHFTEEHYRQSINLCLSQESRDPICRPGLARISIPRVRFLRSLQSCVIQRPR